MYNFKDGEYLTEDSLGEVLNSLFGKGKVERQFKIGKYKADYRIGNLLIEFDGYRHFSQAKNILRDLDMHEVAESEGFKVMNVPYFIQWVYVCEALGFKDADFGYKYPNGFVDEKAMRPKDFSAMGCYIFYLMLDRFTPEVKSEILATLDDLDNAAYRIGEKYTEI